MAMRTEDWTGDLTGRIDSGPDDLLRSEVLVPQLRFELGALLPWHVRLEKVLLLEYLRMGILTGAEAVAIAARLGEITPAAILSVSAETMSDTAFAVERYVTAGLAETPSPAPCWPVRRAPSTWSCPATPTCSPLR
jgi:argininosuccinate lyase